MPFKVSVPAKINLWLEVIRKRSDGYHELSSLMLPVGVYDHLELELRSGEGISISCDHPGIPTDSRNLVWKAADLFLDAGGIKSGVHIRLEKNIPVAAGLGGGSADAAGVLTGLNHLFSGCFPMDRLHDLARRIGADVPFFLYQHPALAKGVGEDLQRVEGLPSYPILLINPLLTVSTAWVYGTLKLTRGESRIKLLPFMAQPWRVREVMENDLESVTLVAHPVLARMKQWLLDRGAIGALMSGSGPTVFGVFAEKREAERAGVLAREDWPDSWAAVTETVGA